ncbi:histidine kinase [Massilia arenosa]|uniref:Histidine kinase n=1 Tax=Zemynaea arenosa TaxID=2561931 RepID=A0A4Y9S3Q7_9BURK|nr:cache domain-containing protein [Massilia arenosa]TFW16035.1 histidine kinase [Massilia arenosa]
MKLRQKVIVLAVVPLVLALLAIALFVHHQSVTLAAQERATIQQAYLASKEAELRHYVALASHSVSHLYDSGRTDAATQAEALQILSKLSYGDDGYFFVYDMAGKSLMHPRQPELVGQNLWEMRDQQGVPTIQRLIAKARAGGGLQTYNWVKPSTHKSAPKLGYVIPLPRWGWMMGTGIYLDDVDAALAKIDTQQQRNIQSTMAWIAATAIAAALVVAVGGVALNISELRVADAKLKALAQRVVESQEQERARLSRDLHDGISQWLVSVKLQIEAGIIRLTGTPEQREQARAGFEHTVEQLNGVLGEVRRISHDLRPAILDDLGLAAALDHLAHEATVSGGVPVFFEARGSTEGLPHVANTMLFRIAQEALANVERHAGATRADLTLAREGRSLMLTVADDGQGFDPVGVAVHPKRGIGLRNMMERMDAIGGQLSISSSGAGTVVQASVEVPV